jgi:hypothetical protein
MFYADQHEAKRYLQDHRLTQDTLSGYKCGGPQTLLLLLLLLLLLHQSKNLFYQN